MRESDILVQVRLALAQGGVTAFRNNVGKAWTGAAERLPSGAVLLQQARILHAGLCKGSSDLIGWYSQIITPEMVGRKIAIFTAVECKAPSGRTTPEQENFLRQLQQAGGIAFVARSGLDVMGGLAEWKKQKS